MLKNNEKSVSLSQKYVTILGINVLSTTVSGVLTSVRDKISHNLKFSIFTPNPELVLMANQDQNLKNIINAGTLLVPDGVGLNYASKFLYAKPLTIIPGRVLFIKLIELANKKHWRVFFLGGNGSEAEEARLSLEKNYKSIKIDTFKGPILNNSGIPDTEVDKRLQIDALNRINKFKPHLLFVAFGNPKQELWINKNLKSLSINGAMAVGGTFNYVAGKSLRAPQWMETAGLEWFWRLLTEPQRLPRILNAVVIFPLFVLKSKIFTK